VWKGDSYHRFGAGSPMKRDARGPKQGGREFLALRSREANLSSTSSKSCSSTTAKPATGENRFTTCTKRPPPGRGKPPSQRQSLAPLDPGSASPPGADLQTPMLLFLRSLRGGWWARAYDVAALVDLLIRAWWRIAI